MELNTEDKQASVNPHLLFQHFKPSARLMVSVIVPVRDEAENLFNTLEALRLQEDNMGVALDHGIYEVLLLANNCLDHSFEIARKYQRLFPSFHLYPATIELPAAVANIGKVRRLLMDEACERLTHTSGSNGIIASTDGDTEVDPTWIFHIIQEIENGNDAVGGRITIKYNQDYPCNYYVENELYRNLVANAESLADPLEHDPWPSHFQYFGASLAVTCSMYRQVGGLPQLPWLEDEALHQALFLKDAKIRKSLKVKVTTSHRHDGRVEVGFSQQLREWAEMNEVRQPQLVPSAEESIIKFTCRQKLRKCWLSFTSSQEYNKQELKTISSELFLNHTWLQQELEKNIYFGKLWKNVETLMYEGKWGKKWKPVRIGTAIKRLQSYTERALQNQYI